MKLAFKKSATACLGLDAPPKDFVVAQFVKFEEYGRHLKRNIYPQPHHMHGVQAMARFRDYESRQEDAARRQPRKSDRIGKGGAFAGEERKLKSLVRIMRVPDMDVLTERPEEFSKGFLESKHIWDLVAEVYAERN